MIANLPLKLATVRHDICFADCLGQCAREPELVANFDRLLGTNLNLKGSALDITIDETSGRLDCDLEKFIEFCWEYIFLRFGN